jgi:hypothetical protein
MVFAGLNANYHQVACINVTWSPFKIPAEKPSTSRWRLIAGLMETNIVKANDTSTRLLTLAIWIAGITRGEVKKGYGELTVSCTKSATLVRHHGRDLLAQWLAKLFTDSSLFWLSARRGCVAFCIKVLIVSWYLPWPSLNPLRTEVYFCPQNKNAYNIGNFTTLLKPHNIGAHLKGIETSFQLVPLFLKSFHFWVSYITVWNFRKISVSKDTRYFERLSRSDRTDSKMNTFCNWLYEWKACSKTFQMSTNVVLFVWNLRFLQFFLCSEFDDKGRR